MKVSLNLATQPFRRDRIFYAVALLAGLTLATVGALMAARYVQSYRRSPELARQAAEHRRQLSALTQKQAELEAVLRRPQNSAVLERSIFLNDLLYRKGISWTKTFADLEQLMPPRVRLISIRPQVTPDNEVSLDMQVGSESREAFVEFLKGLEGSELFRSPALHADTPPSDQQPLFRFRVSVIYEQKL